MSAPCSFMMGVSLKEGDLGLAVMQSTVAVMKGQVSMECRESVTSASTATLCINVHHFVVCRCDFIW